MNWIRARTVCAVRSTSTFLKISRKNGGQQENVRNELAFQNVDKFPNYLSIPYLTLPFYEQFSRHLSKLGDVLGLTDKTLCSDRLGENDIIFFYLGGKS